MPKLLSPSQPSTSERGRSVLPGIFVIVLTVAAMALTDAFVKFSSADLSLWQIYVLRSLLAIPALLLLARGAFRPADPVWVALRSLALVAMYLAIYAAIPIIDLSVVAASLYTGPLFIVLLSAVFLREPIALHQWGAVLIGFVGVVIVVGPAASDFSPLSLIPVAAALLYALAAVLTRAKCSGEPALTLAIWLNGFLLIFGGAASLLVDALGAGNLPDYPFLFGGWQPVGGSELAVLCVLAFLIVAVSVGLARAYQSPKPQIIATFDYTYLIFAAFWGYVFFGEVPGLGTLIGMMLISMAGLLAVIGPRPGRAAVQP